MSRNNFRYSYIYQIINKINGKSYIGKTTQNIEKYIERHYQAKDKKKVLHRAILKYRKENFTWRILWEGHCNNNWLNKLEKYYIYFYDTYIHTGYGYNLTLGGDGGGGRILSEKTKKKISKSNKGKKLSKEHRKIIGQNNRNRVVSKQTRIKMSKARKGHEVTKETCKKISQAKQNMSEEIKEKFRGENNPSAKKFLLIDPDNKNYYINGTLRKFCSENDLNFAKMRNHINKGIIKLTRIMSNTTDIIKNCENWQIYRLN